MIEFKDDSVDSVETPCKVPPHLSNGLHLSTSSPLHLTNTSGNSRPPALEVTGSSSHLRETDDFSIADCNTGDLANMMLDVSDTGDLTSDGCFSGILLRDRDELSRTDDSYPTEDRDEQRGKSCPTHPPPHTVSHTLSSCRQRCGLGSGTAHLPVHSDAVVQEGKSKGLAQVQHHQQISWQGAGHV